MKKELIVLIDGSSYLYRAFHALPPLTNSKGLPTGAIYGVISMINKLIHDYSPHYIAVVFDAKGKTFRHELYTEYKAHRPPMPEELQQQIAPLHDIIRALHLPLLIINGVEADDVIGTLAKQAEEIGLKVVISTGDKDMTQLVNDNITLINTMTNVICDRNQVIKKFGVPPELITDYLALIGDTSDNVPGVAKVGPKTAEKWLSTYNSLDNIMQHASDIPGKIGENLRASLTTLPIAKTLVTIRCDIPLDYIISDLVPGSCDKEALSKLYSELEFKSLLATLLKTTLQTEMTTSTKKYHTILDETLLDNWLVKLTKAELISFDIETDSLNYMEANIVGLSFAITPQEAIYIPLAHDYPGAPKQLDRQLVLTKVKVLLENKALAKVGHNLKYDKEVLANYQITLDGIAFDTMLESYVIDSTANRHDLYTLALKYLNQKTIAYEEVAGKGVNQITFNQVTLEKATAYAAEDAAVTLELHQMLWPKIAVDEKLKHVFNSIELPLLTVLCAMERNGVLVDCDMLKKQSKELAIRAEELEKKAFELCGCEFNLNSPKQLQKIFYEKLKLPIIKKTPTGQPSTAEPILQELAVNYELPAVVLEYRSLTKLKSTYTDRLPEQINNKTHRIHTSYHQAVAGTGRLSSSDPNLQNIPIRTEAGRKIRQAFIASPGFQIVAADYSQIELRIMAHLSGDRGLIDAFVNELDVHKATAAQVFGISLQEVSAEQRRKAKAINFGLIYGMSAFGLAKQLGVERAAAQAYIDSYFAQYPNVHDYMERTRKIAHQKGYVETLFGRRLYLSEINAKNLQLQKAAERAAINAPMQGTAADIIKLAMIRVYHWLQSSAIEAKLIMQVHDELVFEVAKADIEEARINIEQLMSQAAKLAIPLVVDIGVGNNWDEAH
ncbi:MAG: DNA polymerase I [Gammaproteobacteria bacterium RIFCSPHIGHO2_12_FULL_35_23]|nr:MAG: DNA polymerase I [Gammaproteobacteria bacterium RIFCSPHIGHO2_12_FULL_35_23]